MALPTGLVTFLLTDVVGSTGLWRDDPEAAKTAMSHQAAVITDAVAAHDGVQPVEQGEGDSTVSVFVDPAGALRAALEIQRQLLSTGGPRVRMGVHTGIAELVDDRSYGGTAIILAARLRDATPGAQVTVSNATAALTVSSLPEGASLEDLGPIDLKGFDKPEVAHRLGHPDLPAPGVMRRGVANLPNFPTSLVGREREIADVAKLVADAPLVTITGAGGSGKTRLAHAVALHVREKLAGGAIWVDLGRISDGGLVATTTLKACGLPGRSDANADLQLSRFLEDREVLIVFDNCEHLLDAVADLAAALVSPDQVGRVLTTSREPLGVPGEISWRIPSLSAPPDRGLHLDEVVRHGAVQLFIDRARGADPGFVLDEATCVPVARVCRRLDGIPLALELAAARLRMMSAADLADRLDDRFDVLTSGARGGIERQRTLLASVAWSYDLCDGEERVVLRRLSVFASRFSLAAAEAVVADSVVDQLCVFEALGRLVDRNLVQHHRGRYSLLETIRAFASDRADDSGELISLRDRHLDWCLKRTGDLGIPNGLGVFAGGDVARTIVDEAPDLRQAIDWAMARRPEVLGHLTQPLSASLITSPRGAAEATRLAHLLEERLEPRSVEWLNAITPVIVPLTIAGELDWIEPARAVLADHPDLDPTLVGRVRCGLALMQAYDGERSAHDEIRAASELCRSVGDDWGSFVAMMNELFWASAYGDLEAARPILAWVERQIGIRDDSWWTFQVTSATVAAHDGQHDRAAELIAPALELGVPVTITQGAMIGWLYADRELLARACDAATPEMDDGLLGGAIAWAEGLAAVVDRSWATARESMVEAIGRNVIPTWGIPPLAAAVELDLYLDGPEQAEARLRTLPSDFLETRHAPWNHSLHLVATGLVALAGNDHRTARTAALEVARIARSVDNPLVAHRSLGLLAVALGRDDKHIHEASRWLGSADAHSEQTGLTWLGPVFEAATAELRDRVDETAYQEGRAISVLDAVAQILADASAADRPGFGWDALTPAEERVVELAAEGKSNKEIAEAVNVSVSTVKTHLVHVYQKLGLDSRPALVAAAARRPT